MWINLSSSFKYFFVIASILSVEAYSASFKCKDAKTKMEKTICSDSKLSKLDSQLGDAYKTAIKLKREEIKSSQRKWLKEKRNKCSTLDCLYETYEQRISSLDVISAGQDIYISAYELAESSDYRLGKELLLRAAEKGNKRALYGLAIRFGIKKKAIIPVLKEELSKGNMDALFLLVNQYGIGDKNDIFHAAENGSVAAVEWLISKNYYGVDDNFIYNKNPSLAYQYYLLGKESNPSLTFYNEKKVVEELAMCAHVGELDIDAFLESRKLGKDSSPWRQARVISIKENKPELVLQLICIGGDIPFERGLAVRDAYKALILKRQFKFYGCSYAQGSYSMAICSRNDKKRY